MPIKQIEFQLKFLAFSTHFQQANVFDLFYIIFLLRLDSLASKSIFVNKFACANLALKISAARVVIYLSWLWSVSFLKQSH